MKGLYWFALIAALLILLTMAAIPFGFPERVGSDLAPFLVAAVISGAVCFLGALGLIGWQLYLDSKNLGETEKQQITDFEGKLIKLQSQVNSLSDSSKIAQKPTVYELMQLAEKMRKKTTRDIKKDESTQETTDEVPADVQAKILTHIDNIFSPDNNVNK